MNEISSVLGLYWLGIGFSWLIYVMVVAFYKRGRIAEGALVGCVLGWPITLTGYLVRLKTKKRNPCDPLDMTDFAEEYRKVDEEAERAEYERLKNKFENKGNGEKL